MGKRSNLWPIMAACRLCGTTARLCRSHIIPKFVGDWLRATGVTGRMRTTDVPNRRLEGVPWRHLLCVACEARFNRFETEVCESIFLPLHEDQQQRFRYGAAFPRFAVSVAWRMLIMLQAEAHLGGLVKLPEQVDSAERTWREYLLEQRGTPAPYEVQALPLNVATGTLVEDASPLWSRFLLRTVSQTVHCRGGAAYLIVKMARLMVFGTIAYGNERRRWNATKLHADGGAWGSEIYQTPDWVVGHLKFGAQKVQKTLEGLSHRQQRLTHAALMEAARRDPKAVAASGLFRGVQSDVALFGGRAFHKPPTDAGSDDR